MIQKRFWWHTQSDEWHIGVLDIGDGSNNDVYRILIQTRKVGSITYSHYKYERFDQRTKLWSMSLEERANNPIAVLASVRGIFKKHILEQKVKVVFLTIDKNEIKRYNALIYFCEFLFKKGYQIFETEYMDLKLLIIYCDINLLKMIEDGSISDFIFENYKLYGS